MREIETTENRQTLSERLNLDAEVDYDHGIRKRVISTFQKHWHKSLPIIHITNDKVSWGPKLSIRSTGFVASIREEGLRQFSNAGFVPDESMSDEINKRHQGKDWLDLEYITREEAMASPKKFLSALDRIRKEFIHHGLRTNKLEVLGEYSIPAVVIMERIGHDQAGDDSPIHLQTNQHIGVEHLIGVFQFDPENVISNFLETGNNSPDPMINSKKSKRVPFRVELSKEDRKIRNQFVRMVVHKMALFRMKELSAAYIEDNNQDMKDKIALAAHELVDIYVASPDDFDEFFKDISDFVREEIKERRKKFNAVQFRN